MVQADNRKIAKNTIYLYGRTFFVLFVTLYSTRLVFHALGVTDLGIYNVVGGIVTLFSFLQAAQTQATTRFITYELGKESTEYEQQRVFSICTTIHVLIALLIVVITETVGLLVVNHWTSIPPERMAAANIIYQFSIIAIVIQVLRVPYDSVIIAHEKMSVYAYMSIFEVVLKLLLAVSLFKCSGDRLILYGGFTAFITFLLFFCYYLYVNKQFKWYKFKWLWDKKDSVRVLSFSGWTLLGSGTNTMTQQGVSLLMNNYVGLVANTALGFAQQVNSALNRFVTSFATAFNPQVIKLYAGGESVQMHRLICRASKFSFALCYVFALPLIVNMPFVLRLWLGEIPEYTVIFCQLIVACTIIDATTGVFYTAITATGKIRGFQIGISISFALDLLCAFLLLASDINPAIVFGSRIITRGFFNMGVELFFMKRQLDFNLLEFIKTVLLPILITILVSVPIIIYIGSYGTDWVKLITTTLVSVFVILMMTIFVILKNEERRVIVNFIKSRINGRFKI